MDNKSSKYLKYAFGEIVLVVIGILIALQINNWNEKRKINNNIDSVFTLLVQELQTNIQECNTFLKYGYYKDSIQNLFNQNKVTPEMIRTAPRLILRDFGTRTIKFLDDRLIEVIASEKQLQSQYKDLIPELKLLKSRIDEHRFWESKALELAGRKEEEYVSKYPWYYSNDSISNEKRIQFVLTDTIYRNNVNHYTNLQLNENVWYASLMRTSSVALLWKLKQILGYEDMTVNQFLKDLNLKPFEEFDCSDKPYKVNDITFRRNIIIYNNTNDSITYHKISKLGKAINSVTVPPNEFLLGYEKLQYDRFIELRLNNECIKVYKQDDEDYLLLD